MIVEFFLVALLFVITQIIFQKRFVSPTISMFENIDVFDVV
ncbi:hypothetical protein [Spirosoma utsteinense]|uniref:Uncharacterized protein n=1 Tax=Spirosoma utsteinense TaxID=2585773 RepID=A0ABR6W185_9BACT|nr:hypothetical protein [Spirosoma utsteinense]MBC3789898.1 hypothetical protein [Spirosoma utsteinense]